MLGEPGYCRDAQEGMKYISKVIKLTVNTLVVLQREKPSPCFIWIMFVYVSTAETNLMAEVHIHISPSKSVKITVSKIKQFYNLTML